jgi:hypothetical protein
MSRLSTCRGARGALVPLRPSHRIEFAAFLMGALENDNGEHALEMRQMIVFYIT